MSTARPKKSKRKTARTTILKSAANPPLQPWSTSRPMTCTRDMLFHAMYGADRGMVLHYVRQSSERLGAPWDAQCDVQPDVARALFFLLLDRDMGLKEAALRGVPKHGIEPMAERKAENFFLGLREEAIEPWLCDERVSTQQLLD